MSFVVLIAADVSAIEPNGLEGFSKELIESDNKALFDSVTYRGLPPILNNQQSEETSAGTALMVVRTGIQGVESEKLNQLAEQVAALVNNQDLRLVTLSDVNATSEEAKRGAAVPGQLLSFNENQSVVNAALTRGIGLVLFVDLLHFNSKASTVPGAAKLNILNARASLTLLNAADGFRVKAVNREVIARGVDPANLQDKAFDLLARDLVSEVNAWKVPSVRIKLVELEVHAKMDGIFFPIVDVSSDRGDIKIADVPVFAEDASVEVDGVLKGRAPCRISVTPGTHKLKVYREGTQPFNAVIQVTDSNRYDALLVPTPAFRRRFDEQMEKFERIKTIALKRKAELEAAGVRVEGLRVDNANVRDAGVAKASLIQSRADVARQTSEAKAEMTRSEASALTARTSSEASALAANTAVKGQVSVLDAESRSKTAEGKLAIEKETAQAKAEMTRSEASALTAQTSSEASA
ncbi:MAG: PEGA domain-containing protein, partial [Verrucomicrobiota bacterium]